MVGTGTIWELVNKYGRPDHPLGKLLIPMDEQARDEVEQIQANIMTSMGIPNKVILAYQDVLILYLEHEAITRALLTIGDPELRGVLPEILSKEEAAYCMEQEYWLSSEETALLKELLPDNDNSERCVKVNMSWMDAVRLSWTEEKPWSQP